MVKISVIVPCHNDGQYLPRCLDSLTGQTLQDIEILVVENRSSDNSQAVIEEYAQKDSRIKALSISTESLSLARNKGLDKASGEPSKKKVGKITHAQAEEIAKTKMPDLNAASIESAVEMIKGTARSMGIIVEE